MALLQCCKLLARRRLASSVSSRAVYTVSARLARSRVLGGNSSARAVRLMNSRPTFLTDISDKSTIYRRYATIRPTPQKLPQCSKKRASELLSASTPLMQAMKMRLGAKKRPFTVDEISAFVSWVMMGNFMWIFIGTTTFVGLIFFLGNLFKDGEINKRLLKTLITLDNNLEVDVSNPDFKVTWENGKIKLRNLKVRSKPGSHIGYTLDTDRIDLTLSFNKWVDGRGLIQKMAISGLTGEVELPGDVQMLDVAFDESYTLDGFKLSDSHVVFKGEMLKEPLALDVFTCDMNKLRRAWIVYDFMNADALSGSLNGSLFTLHKHQNRYIHFAGADEPNATPWKKIARLRMDQVDLAKLFTEKSKANWVSSGKAELILDVMLPNEDPEGIVLSKWQRVKEETKKLADSSEERKRVKNAIVEHMKRMVNTRSTETTADSVEVVAADDTEKSKYVVMDFKVNLYNFKAAYPKELPRSSLTHSPYISSKDMKSVITFINDKKFGLTSSGSKVETSTANGDSDVSPFVGDSTVPPLKFRLVENLDTFKYVDFASLMTLQSAPYDLSAEDESREAVSFAHTNRLIDSAMTETLSLLLLYKEESRLNLIRKYSERTGAQIFLNDSVIGSLLLVGLGSFMI